MGKSTAATLKEIEEVRHRLERDVAELSKRLPPPVTWAKRLAGLAVGGGVGGSVFWFVVHRVRAGSRRAREKREKAEREVTAPATVIENPVIQVLPPAWPGQLGELMESGRWKAPAAAIAAVWLVMKWAELRRLKRLTEAAMIPR